MMQQRTYILPIVFLSALGLLATSACGNEVDPELGTGIDPNGRQEGAGGAAGTGMGGAAGGGAVFAGGGDGPVEECTGIQTAAEPLPVDMYIMLDQSTSMAEILPGSGGDKWTGVVSAIQAFVQNPGATGIGVGIQYFGQPDECNPAAYQTPEVPIGLLPGVAQQIVDSTNLHGPTTFTPTYPALKGALDHMVPIAIQNAGNRAAVVVLATDGFPTRCKVDGTVEGGASIQDLENLAAQYAQLDPPVRTYVVGVGEALSNLKSIAEGGGTGQPFLIESGDVQQQFLQTMLSIASTPLQCEFEMPTESSEGVPVDKDEVLIRYTAAATQETEEILKLRGPGDCAINRGEGWYYDHPDTPTQINICPDTCKRFAAGSISIVLGCRPDEGNR